MTKRKTAELAMIATQRQLADTPPPTSPLDASDDSPPANPTTADNWALALGQMSPLTEPSDLEDDSELRVSQRQPPTRNTSTRKRKAPEDPTKPSPKRQKKQSHNGTPASHAKRPRVSETATPVQVQNWKWNLTTLVSRKYVFVRLNDFGKPADDKNTPELQSYWWPAKIISTPNTGFIDVQLYGDDGKGARRKLSFRAGEANAKPYMPMPFNKSTFANPPALVHSMARYWGLACKALDRDESGIRSSDDLDPTELATPARLPLPLPSLSAPSPVTVTKPTKNRPKVQREFSPPTVDLSINVPGERVLSRMPKSGRYGVYWPAIVLAFQDPTPKNKRGLYELEVFNGQRVFVERDEFLLRHEEAFSTCKLGDFPSSGMQDDDSDSEDIPWRRRSPSPPPDLPDLPLPDDGGETFRRLPMSAQFALVAPILTRVMLDTYVPALQRNDDFRKGRRKRQHLSQTAGIRGPLTSEEMAELRMRVIEWSLGDERWAQHIDDDGDLIPHAAVPVGEPSLEVSSADARDPGSPTHAAASPRHPSQSIIECASEPVAASSPTLGDHDSTLALCLDGTGSSDPPGVPPSSIFDIASESKSSPPPDDTRSDMHPIDEDIVMTDAPAEELHFAIPAPLQQSPPPDFSLDSPRAVSVGSLHAESAALSQEEHVGLASLAPLDVLAASAVAEAAPSGDHVSPTTLTSPSLSVAQQLVIDDAALLSTAHESDATEADLPPSSLPASTFVGTSPPPSQSDVVGPPSPASRVEEVSPSSTLPAAESSPRNEKTCLQTGSPASQSGAETRVDEASSSRTGNFRKRRVGSDWYENLAPGERPQYCLDVLIFEAVVQLLLWRRGLKRTTEQVLNDDDEDALHSECIAYADQEERVQFRWAWMDTLKQQRRQEDEKKRAPRTRETFNGKSLRPVSKQISYQE
ncbi:hypothetical protein EXIGLDRAFT_833839 [Exidia glandulosa HHB12029]|uniref:Uncharacterized protein n=1 Tax=Exidia glandulosa HHB12029 TaxID=1314781 RepID=A0A165KEJ8_EXIGL|nr:hypothetical protein EXIGLDRAFT_833839 [Exidia glandulosa HHB12029]